MLGECKQMKKNGIRIKWKSILYAKGGGNVQGDGRTDGHVKSKQSSKQSSINYNTVYNQ